MVDAEIVIREFHELVVRSFQVSNLDDQRGIAELRSFLVEHARSREFVQREFAASYALLMERLQAINRPIISWNEIMQICAEVQLRGDSVEPAVEFVSHLGVVHYFKSISAFRHKFVIRDPQWIVDVVKRIISVRPEALDAVRNGVFETRNAARIWREEIASGIDVIGILELCLEMRLIFPIEGGEKMIVPFQLPPREPDAVSRVLLSPSNVHIRFEYTDVLPVDILPHLIASNSVYPRLRPEMVWQNGCVVGNEEAEVAVIKRGKNIEISYGGNVEECAILFGVVQLTLQRSTAKQWPGLISNPRILCPRCSKPFFPISKYV
jgi:hypothetical protein